MTEKELSKEQVESYEENWQKGFYIKKGDGTGYIHACELCYTSHPKRIVGGHYVFELCVKTLRLLKESTIIKWGKRYRYKFLSDNSHPSEPSKIEGGRLWKKIIVRDYNIEMFNKHFLYEQSVAR